MGCSQSIPVAEVPNAVKREIFPTSVSVQQTQREVESEDGSRMTRGSSSDSLPSTQLVASSATPEQSPPDGALVEHIDFDEAMELQLKGRLVDIFGANHNGQDQEVDGADDDDDANDPFADDSSAVFDVDEDFLLDDNASVQEALRGLTLEAKLSLVELVRSSSVNQLMSS